MLDLEEAKPNISLLAGRYSLLDHERALQRVMPAAVKHNMDIVVGGPYSSGILAGGAHFEYQKHRQKLLQRLRKSKLLQIVTKSASKAGALQFSLANPAVALLLFLVQVNRNEL